MQHVLLGELLHKMSEMNISKPQTKTFIERFTELLIE